MNKEQKQAMINEIIENSTWFDFDGFLEFAVNENEELMNELENKFGEDWEKFGDCLMHRLIDLITVEELTVAMNIQENFDMAFGVDFMKPLFCGQQLALRQLLESYVVFDFWN